MSMKYIIVNHGGAERVYIFDESVQHIHFAKTISARHEHIVAAGFIRAAAPSGCQCLGVSTSLGIGSRGDEDTRLVNAALGAAQSHRI
ncbi:MAG: hypothetical protein HQL37_14625 [Alphaproteobacteria bacterium]|nr:hypothetical protein [Alphaproteobacteria bacterium]